MQKSTQKERNLYVRNVFISFGCVLICLGIDIRTYIQTRQFQLDTTFFISLVVYIALLLLGIHSVRKIRKIDHDASHSTEESDSHEIQ